MRGLSTIPTATAREHCSPRRRGLGVSAHRVAVDLTPQAVERIADRVAQLLSERQQGEPELLSAGELARRLRVERPWVYRNRALLGGIRIGAGPKAPWRFNYQKAVEAQRLQQATQPKGGGL
jgi:hypothetical protein